MIYTPGRALLAVADMHAARTVLMVVTIASTASCFTMKNRFHPDAQEKAAVRAKLKSKATVAHEEMRNLESFIMDLRMDKIRENNLTASKNATLSTASKHLQPGRYAWESEEDFEWTSPLLDQEDWQEMPGNQRYSRAQWFNHFNDSYLDELYDKGRDISSFVFAMSTGHCGTTTMSVESAYKEIGYNASHCHFGFETLAQGTRDFFRLHPGRGASRAFVRRYFLPSVIEMTLAAGKRCFIDFGHHTLFGHLMSTLKAELGARMTTVRLRRSRLDTATSYGARQG